MPLGSAMGRQGDLPAQRMCISLWFGAKGAIVGLEGQVPEQGLCPGDPERGQVSETGTAYRHSHGPASPTSPAPGSPAPEAVMRGAAGHSWTSGPLLSAASPFKVLWTMLHLCGFGTSRWLPRSTVTGPKHPPAWSVTCVGP